MTTIGLFVGSTTGKTEAAAEEIQAALGGEDVVTIHEISEVEDSDFELLLSSPSRTENYWFLAKFGFFK